MFNNKLDATAQSSAAGFGTALKGPKRKTIREEILDETKEYVARPNAKKLKELKDKCGERNINFE